MSEITDERRRIATQHVDQQITDYRNLGNEAAMQLYDDILAMLNELDDLREEALPWSIDEMRECITQLGPAATLTADPRRSHEISIKGKYARGFMRRLQRTITGPDEGEEPKVNHADYMDYHAIDTSAWTYHFPQFNGGA